MAVPEKTKPVISEADFKSAILDAVAELYDEHSDQIQAIRSRAEGQSITVTFGNVIDCSESQPVVTTKIRFCETYTDERTNKISKDDKNQLKFETVEHAGRGGRKSEPEPEGTKPVTADDFPDPDIDPDEKPVAA